MRILISGTSSGIGRHLAERLAGEGHEVWGLARSRQEVSFRSSVCDVSRWEQVDAVRLEIEQSWTGVDAVICAAAIQGAVGPAMRAEPAAWSQTVRVDLDGTYFVIRAFWELLQRRAGRAKAICFSGGGATKARPNFSAYGAAKTAVVRLVETLAEEWAGDAVDINAIAPGAIVTAMTRETVRLGPELSGAGEFEAARRHLENGGQSMEKVDALVDFLLSEKSDGVTGRLLSAQWDDVAQMPALSAGSTHHDLFRLRRVTPEEARL